MWRLASVAVAFGAFALLVACGANAAAPNQTPGGRIGFTSDKDGDAEVYVINMDGSGLTNLTNDPADDFDPHWTSDGKRLVFVSNRDYEFGEIYTATSDGSDVKRLTDDYGTKRLPRWSPDGKTIALEADGGGLSLQVMLSDGSSRHDLNNRSIDGFAWSPDGSLIAYFCDEELYVIRPDGEGAIDLGEASAGMAFIPIPAWSPDGKSIAFSTGISFENGEAKLPVVRVVKVDGSGTIDLTDGAAVDMMPAWSPDGRHIAFVSNRDSEEGDIYLMDPDGSNVIRLTNDAGNNPLPLWSPDGKTIAFLSDRDGPLDIYLIDADGTNERRLTTGASIASLPVWLP